MQEKVFDFLMSFGLSAKAMILFLSALPVTELRASIPIGIVVLKQGVGTVLLFSILGNILPIAPIYFFLEPVSMRLSRTACMKIFFEWLFKKAKDKSGIIPVVLFDNAPNFNKNEQVEVIGDVSEFNNQLQLTAKTIKTI